MTGTDRLKFNPPLGSPPVLQWATPGQLTIDDSYQRSVDNGPSQRLIRQIAQHWNWDLCQPLVVARRPGSGGGVNGELYVIDGQHRLAAAKLRRDIPHLPCVILDLPDKADEAANFVHLNQRRRPLSKLNVFKAAVASGDTEALAIVGALDEAGLSIASGTNPDWWRPGQLVNIGGLQAAQRRHGNAKLRTALLIFADAFRGQVLRYAGTIFPGVMALIGELVTEENARGWMNSEEAVMLVEMLGEASQDEWRKTIMLAVAASPSFSVADAAVQVMADAWSELLEALEGEDEDETEREAFARASINAGVMP